MVTPLHRCQSNGLTFKQRGGVPIGAVSENHASLRAELAAVYRSILLAFCLISLNFCALDPLWQDSGLTGCLAASMTVVHAS